MAGGRVRYYFEAPVVAREETESRSTAGEQSAGVVCEQLIRAKPAESNTVAHLDKSPRKLGYG